MHSTNFVFYLLTQVIIGQFKALTYTHKSQKRKSQKHKYFNNFTFKLTLARNHQTFMEREKKQQKYANGEHLFWKFLRFIKVTAFFFCAFSSLVDI